MKFFIGVGIICIFCLGFLLGIAAAVSNYQRDFELIIKHCAPYNCTTDTECEEEEAERKHKFMQFNIV